MQAYGFKPSMTEPEIVANLFELYKEKVDKLEKQELEDKKQKESEKKIKRAKAKTS